MEPDRPNRRRRPASSISWEQARLFGLLNMALADGYIGSFDTKYHYNYWRPVTAIQTAATDGNPNTSADPTWTPLVPTPPIPDYDSAHSVARRSSSRGPEAVLRHRPHRLQHLQPDAAGRAARAPTRRRSCARYDSFSQAADGERTLAHPRRVPLPQRCR